MRFKKTKLQQKAENEKKKKKKRKKIGRAPCRERVKKSEDAGTLKKKNK